VAKWYEGFDFEHSDAKIAVEVTHDVDHGRVERRRHTITDDVAWLIARHPHWNTIKSIGLIEATRWIGDAETTERRYYVSSLPADPKLFAYAARAHWGIENSLHHVLDVAFREDASKIRCGNAPENISVIRKIALTLVRSDKKSKKSIKKRLKMLAWSDTYFEELLFKAGYATWKNRANVCTVLMRWPW